MTYGYCITSRARHSACLCVNAHLRFSGGQQKETDLLPHCNQSPEKETVEETVENTLSVFLREGNITADRQKARNFLRLP